MIYHLVPSAGLRESVQTTLCGQNTKHIPDDPVIPISEICPGCEAVADESVNSLKTVFAPGAVVRVMGGETKYRVVSISIFPGLIASYVLGWFGAGDVYFQNSFDEIFVTAYDPCQPRQRIGFVNSFTEGASHDRHGS